MPSPIAHVVSGYALSRLPFIKPRQLPSRAPLVVTIYVAFIACCPDLDFLPQFLTGIRFHRGPSHSLLAALVVSGFLAWILHHYRRPLSTKLASDSSSKVSLSKVSASKISLSEVSYIAIFSFTFWIYLSHLILDLLTSGGSGIPLLWPLIPENVQLPFSLFPPVHHSRGLLDPSHLIFISAEIIYAIVLIVVSRLLKRSLLNPNLHQKQ